MAESAGLCLHCGMKNDIAYTNMDFIPDGPAYPERWAEAGRAFREMEAAVGRARLNLPYGPHARQRYDLYLPAGRPAGLVVLIHGGYWRAFDRETFAHLARGPMQAGWACAMPSYPLCPEVRIRDITAGIALALADAAGRVPGPIRLTGHSAGGHLAARMLCSDVTLPEAVRGRIVRVLPVSPLSDLRPLLETTMSAELLHLDEAEALAESPALNRNVQAVPTTVWVGGAERPAFLDQARWLADAWPFAGLYVDPGRHHFDVIEGFEAAGTQLMQALLAD
jgi:arylformamidase